MKLPPRLRRFARHIAHETALGRAAMVGPRAASAIRSVGRNLVRIPNWLWASREVGDFSYRTTAQSNIALCGVVSAVSGVPLGTVIGFLDEFDASNGLDDYVRARHASLKSKWTLDPQFRPARRLAYYLLIRALKPAFIVEAGVNNGLGAILISEALRRNGTGDYLGIEFDPGRDCALHRDYPGKVGSIVYGDSAAVLATLERPVDFFVHDTTTERNHVAAQLKALKLSPRGVLFSTWFDPQFVDYARAHDMGLLVHADEPFQHWYPGSRVTIVYPRPGAQPQ